MMHKLKNLMQFRLLILVIQSKKTDYDTKVCEIEKKLLDHDRAKYITSQEFNRLTTEKFTARLKQANLDVKTDIDGSIKKTDFDNKLKNLNKKVTSNKSKHSLDKK